MRVFCSGGIACEAPSSGCEFSTKGEGTAPDAAARGTTVGERGEKKAAGWFSLPRPAKVSLKRAEKAKRCAGLRCRWLL